MSSVRLARMGRKINCPVAPAAVRMPITRPRRATNQRLAMVAANTRAMDPVPTPTSSPQVISNCHPDWTKIVNPLPAATRTSATLTTRRIPNRSISAAANGAITPYKIRFTLTAVDMSVRGQPNSSCSGIIKTPGAARKPAAPSSATNATTATHHAGWMPVRGGATVATSVLGPRYGIAQRYKRRSMPRHVNQAQAREGDPSGQQGCTRTKEHRRHAHDHLVQQSLIMELADQIAAAHQPDVLAAGRLDHLRMHRNHVARDEADVRTLDSW